MDSYDIVYVVKDSAYNEELRFSLRSVEKNFPCRKIWFYGGKPIGSHPDNQKLIVQKGKNKWNKVRALLTDIATNKEITENFWLFNDDFFVIKRWEKPATIACKKLSDVCARVEAANGNRPTAYTRSLKRTEEELCKKGLTTYNFEEHMPMLFNREKLLKTIETFPNTLGTRSLYGNLNLEYLKESGLFMEVKSDCKIFDYRTLPNDNRVFCSTDDNSFNNGAVGKYIRDMFPNKSRWER